jgi:hypothetical protein
MDFPLLLLVLLVLPFAAAALIVGVSSARRRRRRSADGPVHRFQADTASVQDAVPARPARARKGLSGRERRAGTSVRR